MNGEGLLNFIHLEFHNSLLQLYVLYTNRNLNSFPYIKTLSIICQNGDFVISNALKLNDIFMRIFKWNNLLIYT